MKEHLRKNWAFISSEITEILRIYRFECMVASLGMIVAFVIFRYCDGLTLTTWSVEIWDAIACGGLQNFFKITSENLRGAPHQIYNYGSILLMIPSAIWNFPIWLTHSLRTMSVTSLPCLLWSKLFLVVCTLIAGLVCDQIVVCLGGERKEGRMAAVFFWGSSTLMISIGHFGQDEIIYILFLLCALYCTIAERYKWSIVWMTLSVTMMPAMILPCGLIILFHTSKLLPFVLQSVVLFTPLLLEKVLLPPNMDSVSANYFLEDFFERALLPGGNGNISIFAVVVLLVYAGMFFCRKADEGTQKKLLLYFLACIMTAMCAFAHLLAYRFFICIPFLVLCVFIIKDTSARTAGVTGIFVFEIFRLLQAGYEDYFFRVSDFSSYVKQILNVVNVEHLYFYDVLTKYIPAFAEARTMIVSVAFACGLWLLWLTLPGRERKIECRFSARIIMRIYMLCPLLFIFLYCVMLYHMDIVQISSLEWDDILAPAITGENSLEQYYRAETSAKNASVTIRPVTWLKEYPQDEQLCMDLLDADTEDVIGTVQVPASQLPNNQIYTFEFRGIRMSADKWYIFRLYAPEKIESEENYLFIMRSDDGTADPERHYAVVKENDRVVTTNYDMIGQIIAF